MRNFSWFNPTTSKANARSWGSSLEGRHNFCYNFRRWHLEKLNNRCNTELCLINGGLSFGDSEIQTNLEFLIMDDFKVCRGETENNSKGISRGVSSRFFGQLAFCVIFYVQLISKTFFRKASLALLILNRPKFRASIRWLWFFWLVYIFWQSKNAFPCLNRL